MKDRRKLLVILAGAAICLAAGRLAVSVADRGRQYEIEPVVTLPDYGNGAGRTIDAYERLMERYMDLAESRITDCNGNAQKLDSIDSRIDRISERLARIEKALGIDPNGNPASKPSKVSGTK